MILLYVAICVLDALIILLLIGSRQRWNLVALGTMGALLVNLALLWAAPDTSGLAAHRAPPDGEMIACRVVEPEWVYFWMADGPRSYRLEYTPDLHAVCDTATQGIRQGVRVGLAQRQGSGVPRGRLHPYAIPPSLPTK